MRKVKGLFPAETVSSSCTIDMRFMVRHKYIVRNADTSGVMEWTKGQRVYYFCRMSDDEKYLQLIYSVKDNTGASTNHDYQILIDEVQSNLGKGTVLYFLCPESGKRSRKLISAYGEPRFINREYYEEKYGLRIYYGCQKTSKGDYHNTRYFDLKRKVDALESELLEKHRNSHYRGKSTKEQEMLKKLQAKMEYHDQKRLSNLLTRVFD